MKSQPFKLTPFFNPSGKKVWQVYGRINGKRIRKNFSVRAEAVGFKEAKEIERLNADGHVRTVATRLTNEEILQAERAFVDLRDLGQPPLSDVIDFYRRHRVISQINIALVDAVDRYLEERSLSLERGDITPVQLRNIISELRRFKKAFEKKKLAEITNLDLTAYLAKGGTSLKTHNNRRGILSKFYKFAVEKEWIDARPFNGINHHGRKSIGRKKGEAETLTATQAVELMTFLEGFHDGIMVNHFAATLFAGIRPDFTAGEILKIRPHDFDLDHRQINITTTVSKIDEARSITIQPNYLKWLKKYPFAEFPIIPTNCRRLRLEVRKKFSLGHDVLRHTYCSFLYSKTKDLGDATRQAGNSTDVFRRHYVNYKQPKEVTKFWNIVPKADKPSTRSKR